VNAKESRGYALPNYTLRQLEYFLTAAEHSSIAGAASALGISQPSVSTALAKLEAQLGVQLFLRHHAQGVSLTPTGQRLLVTAHSLLRHAEELQWQAASEGETVAGTLTVGAFVTLAAVFLPGLISGFRGKFPDVSIELIEGTQDDLIDGLAKGRLELALVYSVGLPEELTSTRLAELRPYALLSARHRLAKRKEISLHDVSQEPMILLDIAPSRGYFLGVLKEVGIEPKLLLSSPSLEVVRGLVGRGLGYSVLVTRPYGDHSYDGTPLAAMPIRELVGAAEIAIVRSPGLRPTRLMQAFVDYCVEEFSTHDSAVTCKRS
jgi:DNA-binding transcriptional LysR family regulator